MIEQLRLEMALLLYSNAGSTHFGETLHYWQIHPVKTNQRGKSVLEAGRSVSQEDLETLCKAMAPSMIPQLGWVDPGLLAYGAGSHGPLVFYRPSIKRAMYFGKQSGLKSGIVPWPSLVLAAHPPGLSVYVIKGKQRPHLDTELFYPPFYNVYADCTVCVGQMATPPRATPADMEPWAESFYNSAFTHTNARDRQFIEKGSLKSIWSDLLSKKRKRFPYHLLKSTQKTIKDLLRERGLYE